MKKKQKISGQNSHNSPELEKLYSVVSILNISSITDKIKFEIDDTMDFPACCTIETEDNTVVGAIISFTSEACRLPDKQVEVLLLHEIYHFLEYNNFCRFQHLPCHTALNLALDICINRILVAAGYSSALASMFRSRVCYDVLFENFLGKLNKLNDAGNNQENSFEDNKTLYQVNKYLFWLASPCLPSFKRLPKNYYEIWSYLWKQEKIPSPEECYQQIIPLFENLDEYFDDEEQDLEKNLEQEQNLEKSLEEKQDLEKSLEKAQNLEKCKQIKKSLKKEKADKKQDCTEHKRVNCPNELCFSSPGKNSNLQLQKISNPYSPRNLPKDFWRWIEHQNIQKKLEKALYKVVGDIIPSISKLPYLLRPTVSSLIKKSCGWPQIYYNNKTPQSIFSLPIYIDSSNSMQEHSQLTLLILKKIKDLLPSTLWAFDTKVVLLPRSAVLDNKLFSGDGTDFDCIWLHAMEKKYKDFLVITDGKSFVSDEIQERGRQKNICGRAILIGRNFNEIQWWSEFFEWHSEEE